MTVVFPFIRPSSFCCLFHSFVFILAAFWRNKEWLIDWMNDRPMSMKQVHLGSITSGPIQPALKRFPMTTFGIQNIAFSASLYTKYNFLEYSVKHDAAYWFPSRVFHSGSVNKEPAFTLDGVRNWKNIDKYWKHAASSVHGDCSSKWKNYKESLKTGSIAALLYQRSTRVMFNVIENTCQKLLKFSFFGPKMDAIPGARSTRRQQQQG